eukprot:68576-Prymnesium_polylepis.1
MRRASGLRPTPSARRTRGTGRSPSRSCSARPTPSSGPASRPAPAQEVMARGPCPPRPPPSGTLRSTAPKCNPAAWLRWSVRQPARSTA